MLTKGKETCIELSDWSVVQKYNWSTSGSGKYVEGRVAGKLTYLHKFLVPSVNKVDHRDRNGFNNKRSNLRQASRSDNQANRLEQRNNTSGFKGVSWSKAAGKWEARIKHEGKQTYLGVFDDAVLAAAAYNGAARYLFGEFAFLNTI